jgi:septum formation protein
MKRQIILASISPRRRELMNLLKIKFKAVDSGYTEVMHKHLSPKDLVRFLAVGKARAAAKKYPKAIIIAADTVVSFKGKAIGKPKNKQEVFKMLKSFSGQTQEVFTGAVVLDAANKAILTTVATSKIYFKALSQKEIFTYSKSGEAMDKAGGYGPLGKGMNLLKKIEGDYTTAIGLPMEFVFNALAKLDVEV